MSEKRAGASASERGGRRAADSGEVTGSHHPQVSFDMEKSVIIQSGCNSMVECKLPKLEAWVRFPSPAPSRKMYRKMRIKDSHRGTSRDGVEIIERTHRVR